MLSCHLAYFIALPDALVSGVPLIPLCMPLWQGTCSAQLFIVIGLSGCSISIIKEQATGSLALIPVPPCNASPSDSQAHFMAVSHSSFYSLRQSSLGIKPQYCLSTNWNAFVASKRVNYWNRFGQLFRFSFYSGKVHNITHAYIVQTKVSKSVLFWYKKKPNHVHINTISHCFNTISHCFPVF